MEAKVTGKGGAGGYLYSHDAESATGPSTPTTRDPMPVYAAERFPADMAILLWQTSDRDEPDRGAPIDSHTPHAQMGGAAAWDPHVSDMSKSARLGWCGGWAARS